MQEPTESFVGDLDSIDPHKLIDPENPNDLDRVFLVLALIYNDLKGLMTLDRTLRALYKPIDPALPPCVHNGEMGGILNQSTSLICSTVSEILVYLEKERRVITSKPFQAYVGKLPAHYKKDFNDIWDIARKRNVKTTFGKRLANIRNQIGFHFNWERSENDLVQHFIAFFSELPKTTYNSSAYYSLGKNMEHTRFYYADAAAQHNLVSEGLNSNELGDVVGQINRVLANLLFLYLDSKRKMPSLKN